ncbi:1-aminocyclopropane-1-carboxylate deaminase [Lewinella aquimaris]|uniref:1-aminocyclopropane-1-carboxylate deaminase n=1 Tax=Neolewinella aquimaris TaxID=1835722 RepID=A0A840EJL2_9BACT|nr:pyridoxal-phosphate dependent enzyme [Neolewinella aquimaris]MBB4081066.1 1-aminocyclopropane-1-carboxylate deaminase [Neolewinella aquimaris]
MLPPSPLQQIKHPDAVRAGINLWCKRDDLYAWYPGSPLQGNKVRKLWPLLLRSDLPGRTVVSFGGAYSNHVAALAAAGHQFGFATRFYLRGEAVRNPTLDAVLRNGGNLHFISRTDYRLKHDHQFQRELGIVEEEFVIPEGGTSPESLPYTGEVFRETVNQFGAVPPDFFCLSAGTGGTAAGIIGAAADTPCTVEVFPALRGSWMRDEILRHLEGFSGTPAFTVIDGYHFGGYGRFSPHWKIRTPIGATAKRADIGEPGLPELEPVYTAKLFSGVLDRIRTGAYPRGSTVVVLHTGGIY